MRKSCNNACKESWCCSHWIEYWKIFDDLHFDSIENYDRWLDNLSEKAACALTRGANIYMGEAEFFVVWNLKCQHQTADGKCGIHDSKSDFCAEFPKKNKNAVISEKCKYTGKFIVLKNLKKITNAGEIKNALK